MSAAINRLLSLPLRARTDLLTTLLGCTLMAAALAEAAAQEYGEPPLIPTARGGVPPATASRLDSPDAAAPPRLFTAPPAGPAPFYYYLVGSDEQADQVRRDISFDRRESLFYAKIAVVRSDQELAGALRDIDELNAAQMAEELPPIQVFDLRQEWP